MRPQFPPRRTQPMRPDSYRRIARLARAYADKIEAHADEADPRAKKGLTDALKGLYFLARGGWRRRQGMPERPPLAAPDEAEP